MIYYTVRNTSGGFYGHQLKDLIGGLTLGKFLELNYVHSYYPFLEYFGVGVNEKKIEEIDYEMDSITIGGPFWGGINFENAKRLKEKYSEYIGTENDLLINFVNALRLMPYQTYQWYKNGIISRNIFDEVISELTEKFEKIYADTPVYFDPSFINIAIQIRQGDANDKVKYPEHFTSSTNVRYQFPVEHYQKIIETLNNVEMNKPKMFHIYTEGYNNDDIKYFEQMANVKIHMSFGSNKNENRKANNDFLHLVKSDILVATTSSFSVMASHFRKGKINLYHPHDHFNGLPEDQFISIDENGKFDALRLCS